jgi:hypothetical protein
MSANCGHQQAFCSSTRLCMNMESYGGMLLTWKTKKKLGESHFTVTLCTPQIPHGFNPGSNSGLRGKRPATNRPSHHTAFLSYLPDYGFKITYNSRLAVNLVTLHIAH